jgi:cell division protein ZapE
MTLLSQYNLAIEQGQVENDDGQRKIIAHLQDLDNRLQKSNRWFFRGGVPVKGLYMYGPVGVGKTYMMDLFYQHVKTNKKSRFHFHHFMQQVDAQLRALQGQKDPLNKIAASFAKQNRLLCLDEFLVYDIADAMILARLLEALFAYDVVLVATSNTKPDDLYLKGLQRVRFLPAIDKIKAHCDVIPIDDNRDYRLGRTKVIKAYNHPLGKDAEQALQEQFGQLSPIYIDAKELYIQKRTILSVREGDGVVWFDFNVICNLPRSQLDYLEIADRYHTVFLSNVPSLHHADLEKVILFMHFIDVMYDKGTRVIISAEAAPEHIYEQGPLHKEFQRTVSRLQEMQSIDYLN